MLPRLLFWINCALSAALIGLVVVAPSLDRSSRLLTLFAEDATVRQTALASALGVLVTGCVFFRGQEESPRKRRPSPRDAVGA